MDIVKFIEDLRDKMDEVGFSLYFGSKTTYNSVKNPPNRVVIVEPFTMRPTRAKQCKYDTTLNVWVGIRRSVSSEFRDSLGINMNYIQEALVEATNVIEGINSMDTVLVNQNIDNIDIRYFEADGNITSNSEEFTNFVLPVTLWI